MSIAESVPVPDVRHAPALMNGKGAFLAGVLAVGFVAWAANAGSLPMPEFPGGSGPVVSGSSQAGERDDSSRQDETAGTQDYDQSEVLTVATFNVVRSKGTDVYPTLKSPEERIPDAMEILKKRDVDIAGIQESDEKIYPLIKQNMPGFGIWPDKYEGSNAGGGRPIIYNEAEFEKVEGGAGFLEVDRYCTRINLPYILLRSPEHGLILVLNHHPSNRKPTANPCSTPGSRKDSGNAVRKKNAYEIKAELRELTKDYTEPITILVTGDFNSTDHIRTNNGKDGDYTKEDLLEYIFFEDGLLNTYAMAKKQKSEIINDKYSTAFNSLTERKKGKDPATRTRLDNEYMKAKPGHEIVVISWENVAGEEGKGLSDHAAVISKVKIVRK